ncbi:MAG: glycosyltransferase family 2 protein [Ornithinimicrobium sp.]
MASRDRSASDLTRRGVDGFLAVKMLVLAINLARFPVLCRADVVDLRSVSVLVPARDEAGRLPGTLPAILEDHDAEVLVLDDSSSDGTAQVARDLIKRSGHPRARVLSGAPLPDGWTGKAWACHQLAEAAEGTIMVFLDADVTLEPGALAAVVAEKRRVGADVFSVFPRQQTGTLGEHLVVPTIDDVLLCLLAHPLLRLPVPSAATAHGACLVFDRDSYGRVGGFAAVRGEVVEDVALARRTRSSGLRLGLALGGDLLHVRMYGTYREVIGGLSRGLMPMSNGRPTVLLLGWAAHLAAYTLPLLLLPRDRRWALPLAVGLLERALVEVKTRRYAVWQALLVPAIAPAMVPLVVRALRGRPTWRGRTYG